METTITDIFDAANIDNSMIADLVAKEVARITRRKVLLLLVVLMQRLLNLKISDCCGKRHTTTSRLTPSILQRLLDRSITHQDYIADEANKIIEHNNYLAEKMNQMVGHQDYLAEKMNQMVEHQDYLAENINDTISLSELCSRNVG